MVRLVAALGRLLSLLTNPLSRPAQRKTSEPHPRTAIGDRKPDFRREKTS